MSPCDNFAPENNKNNNNKNNKNNNVNNIILGNMNFMIIDI